MIYNEIYNRLKNGQEIYACTSLETGKTALLENADAGLFEKEFIEHFTPYPRLVLLGAGHVSAAVCKICAPLGFKITVADDRELACAENFPLADEIVTADFAEFLSGFSANESTYFAILTRGHLHDRLCLEHILKKPCAYIGMIGSRRKNKMVFEQLCENGFTEKDISRVNAPIGIDICAETPEEIAVSIAAQLIQVRRQRKSSIFDEKVLHSLCEKNAAVLATICEKSGSAPRGTGAKMTLLKNGAICGTIGGGSAEARIIGLMKGFSSQLPQLIEIEMSDESAKTEGLICGGAIKVLICKV